MDVPQWSGIGVYLVVCECFCRGAKRELRRGSRISLVCRSEITWVFMTLAALALV